MGDSAALLDLDEEQRAAVLAPAGPVCILAGAGTGKTRAITHRIAHRVLVGQTAARHVLAVTFTARAAGQLRARLTELGVHAVSARTFHASALRQVRYFAPRLLHGKPMPELLESKARLLTVAAGRIGAPTDRTSIRDLASEIEWAKAMLCEPPEYPVAAAKAGRETPTEPDLVARAYASYEQVKRAAGAMDFEDLLRAAVWAIEDHPDVAEEIRAQYRHLVVDEYQDVNPLQQRLLDAWLGDRRDLTVVGDASQTIYSFTGASCAYLLDFGRRYADAVVVRLIRDYRSTPEVVGLANAVIRQAAGEHARMRLELVGQRPAGPAPQIRPFADEPAEAAAVAARCRELIDAGLAAHQIAVLFRTNAQSPAYEEACAQVGVPTVVQGGERFFRRAEVRQALIALRAATRTTPEDTPLVDAVTQALVAIGWRADQPPGGGAARERWEALSALVALAQDWVAGAGHRSLAQFCEELAHRASILHAPPVDGVTLTSLHSAKGLEWEAVFVVGLAEGTLPSPYAKTPTALEEERRLLYVGITRARQWLWLSYASARSPGGRSRRPCRFLPVSPVAGPVPPSRETASVPARRRSTGVRCRVCGATLVAGTDRKLGRCASCPSTIDEEMYERLRQWRGRVATAAKVPAYVVFTDATLIAITERTPTNRSELAELTGIGPHKLERYGEAVLALVAGASVDRLTEPSEATDRDG